jgi:hypothetical protein
MYPTCPLPPRLGLTSRERCSGFVGRFCQTTNQLRDPEIDYLRTTGVRRDLMPVNRMVWGFKSRCTIPALCAHARPSATYPNRYQRFEQREFHAAQRFANH